MASVQMICMANSRKLMDRCVAGLRVDGRGWVRPVGHGSCGALTYAERTLDNRMEPQVLDLIEVDLQEPCPEVYQPENWLIGPSSWKLIARPAPTETAHLLSKCLTLNSVLFGNQDDRLPYSAFLDQPVDASLALVEPKDVVWGIGTNLRGNRQTRVLFRLGNVRYNLVLTDPNWERRLAELPEGTHPVQAAGIEQGRRILFTISLGEPFNGCCYKLVAAVIVVPPSFGFVSPRL